MSEPRADAAAGDVAPFGSRTTTVVVALVYLAIALWCYAAVLPHPASTLSINAGFQGATAQLTRWDQSIAVASITRNAHALLTAPWSFLDGFQCHPLPRSYTLGEHMFGSGILAAVPYLLTRDPLFSFNALLVLTAWIAGLSMYFLAREFLRSEPAAFVAGLLFALDPVRIGGVAHPFAYADQWTPLALLFLHRCFACGGLRNALAFTSLASLEILQSLYPLLWTATLLLFFSVALAIAHRRVLLQRLPLLASCLAALVLVAWLVMGPYLETRATWGVLRNRVSLPIDVTTYFGWRTIFVLAALGFADRFRGPRPVRGLDPRVALLAAGLVLLSIASARIVVPGLGIEVPSLRVLLRSVVPGLDAVRGMSSMTQGTSLVLALGAGYGALVVLERAPRLVRWAVVAALAAWIASEQHVALSAWDAAPPAEDVALLRRSTGPVLELPYPNLEGLRALANADLLRFTSYSPRRSSACYASFPNPLDDQMRALAGQLPDAGVADALYALGFRTVALHLPQFWRPHLKRFQSDLAADPARGERFRLLGANERLMIYDLRAAAAVRSDLGVLAPHAESAPPPPPLVLAPGSAALDFAVVNASSAAFRHPEPIAPTELILRWTTPAGEVVAEEHPRALLPLALAPSRSMTVPVAANAPAREGDYLVTLSTAGAPERTVGRRTVRVAAPPA